MQIMVVDDDAVSRFAMADMLRTLKIKSVLQFEDGAEAWEYLQCRPKPVMCCCDVRMPHMSGIDLLKKIRQDDQVKRLPFVLITSGADRHTVQEALQNGVSGYVIKPFKADEVAGKLQKVFDASADRTLEPPETTLKRLNIETPKLIAYYDAFLNQIKELKKECEGKEDLSEFVPKLEALEKGCATLGLWHGSVLIEQIKSNPQCVPYLEEFLTAIASLVEYQKISQGQF